MTAQPTPESLLQEAGESARAEGRRRMSVPLFEALRGVAEGERVWAAIRGEPVDPLTALKAIVDYVKPISPGTQWADTVVRIAEKAIANHEDCICADDSCPAWATHQSSREGSRA